MSNLEWNCWVIGGWIALAGAVSAMAFSVVAVANRLEDEAVWASFLSVPFAYLYCWAGDELRSMARKR